MILTSFTAIRSKTTLAGIVLAWLPLVGCTDKPDDVSHSEQAVGIGEECRFSGSFRTLAADCKSAIPGSNPGGACFLSPKAR